MPEQENRRLRGTAREPVKRFTLFQAVLSVAVVAALVVVAHRFLGGPAVLLALRSFDAAYLLPVVGLSSVCVLLQAWRFRLLLRPLSDLPSGTVMRAYLSGEGPSLLPGGVTARLALFRQAGVPVGVTAIPLIAVGLIDELHYVGGALLAALWFPRARTAALAALGLLALPALLLLLPSVRRGVARLAAALNRRFHLLGDPEASITSFRPLASLRVLGPALGITTLAFALRIAALGLCLRGLGWTLPPQTLLAAFVVPNLAGQLSFIPGGVGVTEAAMVGLLTRNSTLTSPVALAAAALFRVTAVLPGVLLGTLVFLTTWRGGREKVPSPPEEGQAPRPGTEGLGDGSRG